MLSWPQLRTEKIMKYIKVFLIVAVLSIIILFVLQNFSRTPTLDVNGGYLSLDLGFWGLIQKKPVSIFWYFLGFFVLGMLTSKLLSLRN